MSVVTQLHNLEIRVFRNFSLLAIELGSLIATRLMPFPPL